MRGDAGLSAFFSTPRRTRDGLDRLAERTRTRPLRATSSDARRTLRVCNSRVGTYASLERLRAGEHRPPEGTLRCPEAGFLEDPRARRNATRGGALHRGRLPPALADRRRPARRRTLRLLPRSPRPSGRFARELGSLRRGTFGSGPNRRLVGRLLVLPQRVALPIGRPRTISLPTSPSTGMEVLATIPPTLSETGIVGR